jgi:RimJ/RimL family protein N-acetyltransferase
MNLELRKIDYSNQDLLNKILDWRNDEETRTNSNNTNIITNEIFKLILQKYKESTIDPIIIYLGNVEVGIFTFVKNIDKIFIGININPNYRNMKIGSKSLKLFIESSSKFYIKDNTNKIYASIKKENISSYNLFNKYFKFLNEDQYFNHFYLDI